MLFAITGYHLLPAPCDTFFALQCCPHTLQALNKAITSLYTEVRARPEAKEYIKRVVSEACELNMNRWRVSEALQSQALIGVVVLCN